MIFLKIQNKNQIRGTILVLLYIILVVLFWHPFSEFLIDKVFIRSAISNFGILAPLIFVLIQIVQNIVAPIAHYPILLAGGLIFGPIVGFIYNWIGTSVGTILIILLAKKIGRPLVEKMVNQNFIQRYDHLIKKLSPFGLFLIYALPVFPDDEISYLVGISSMRIRNIIIAIILGKISGAALSFTGNDLIEGIKITIIIQALTLVFGSIFYFRKKIFKLFIRQKNVF